MTTTASLRQKAESLIQAFDHASALFPMLFATGRKDVMADAVDVCRAYCAENPADAPDWYSKDEIYSWLRSNNYSEEIAKELAGLIANNYQLAFNKGFAMGKRAVEKKGVPA